MDAIVIHFYILKKINNIVVYVYTCTDDNEIGYLSARAGAMEPNLQKTTSPLLHRAVDHSYYVLAILAKLCALFNTLWIRHRT